MRRVMIVAVGLALAVGVGVVGADDRDGEEAGVQ